jgi:hypothetical protein
MRLLRLIVLGLIFFITILGCGNKNLRLSKAKAHIDRKSVNFINAQAGITNVGRLYYTLSIVFGASDGQGICLTLAARKEFKAKEYKVKFVERPDIENAQMTYTAADHKIYEAVSKIGSGSVIITELTNNHIKGTFSGKFVLQSAISPVIEIKGEFNAEYTPTEPDL